MQRPVRGLPIALIAFCVTLAVLPAGATMVEPFNLDEMIERAGRAFTGTVTAIDQGTTAEGIPYIAYTFDVSESLKGTVGATVTIRQFGLAAPRTVGDLTQAFKVPSMPTYKSGEVLLLLVSSESSIGLSAPIGLFQGAFRLARGADGDLLANNGSDNVNLFKDMTGLPAAVASHRRGPVKLSVLTERIRERGGQ